METSVATRYNFKNIKKLCIGVMGFEGSEHLYNILTELKDLYDYAVIACQNISYHGRPISETDNKIIYDLFHAGIVNSVLTLSLDMNKEPREQETDKRNELMRFAELEGCSHIIIIDSDEYYNKDSFLNALRIIDDNDYDITYCQYINYYKDYMHYLVYPFKDGMYVPFVSKVYYRFSFNGTDFNKPSDPTRRFTRKKNAMGNYTDSMYVFPWNQLKMHHLSWVRNNIHGKLHSWSAKKCFDNLNDMLDTAIYDFNHFNDLKKRVHLIFNTPDNCVEVAEFPKQYIQPAKDISEYEVLPEVKNILVLNMSTSICDGLYETLEQCCRNTWAKDILDNKYDNITYYSVIDYPGETYVDVEKHKVYVHIDDDDDNISHLTYRYLTAVLLLQDIHKQKYDYIVKTNTSTWLNIPKINKLLGHIHNDSYMFGFRLECAFWSKFNLYLQGNLVIMSKRTFEILNKSLVHLNLIRKMPQIADDVLTGSALSTRLDTLNIPQIENLKVLPCVNLKYKSTDYNTDILSNYAIQVKTFNDDNSNTTIQERLIYDIKKMEALYELSNISEYPTDDNIDIESIIHPVEYHINLYPYVKSEYLPLSDVEKQRLRFAGHRTFSDIKSIDRVTNALKQKAGYK